MDNILSKTINNVSRVVSTQFYRLNVYESYLLLQYTTTDRKMVYRLFKLSLNGSVDPEEITLPTTHMETYNFTHFVITNSHELVLMGENLICIMALDEMETYIDSEEEFEEAVRNVNNIGTVSGMTYSSSQNIVYFIADNGNSEDIGNDARNTRCLYSYNLDEACNLSQRKKLIEAKVRKNITNLVVDEHRRLIYYIAKPYGYDDEYFDYYNRNRHNEYIVIISMEKKGSRNLFPLNLQHGAREINGQNLNGSSVLLTLLSSQTPIRVAIVDNHGASNTIEMHEDNARNGIFTGRTIQDAANPIADISNENFPKVKMLEVSDNDGHVYYCMVDTDRSGTLRLRLNNYRILEDKIRKFTLTTTPGENVNNMISYDDVHEINTPDNELSSAHSGSSAENRNREERQIVKQINFNSNRCPLFDREHHSRFFTGYQFRPNKVYAMDKNGKIFTKDDMDELIKKSVDRTYKKDLFVNIRYLNQKRILTLIYSVTDKGVNCSISDITGNIILCFEIAKSQFSLRGIYAEIQVRMNLNPTEYLLINLDSSYVTSHQIFNALRLGDRNTHILEHFAYDEMKGNTNKKTKSDKSKKTKSDKSEKQDLIPYGLLFKIVKLRKIRSGRSREELVEKIILDNTTNIIRNADPKASILAKLLAVAEKEIARITGKMNDSQTNYTKDKAKDPKKAESAKKRYDREMYNLTREMVPWAKLKRKLERKMRGEDPSSGSDKEDEIMLEQHPELSDLPPPPVSPLVRERSIVDGAEETKHGETERKSSSSSSENVSKTKAKIEQHHAMRRPIRSRLDELITNYNKDESEQNSKEKELLDDLIKKSGVNTQEATAQDELIEFVINNNYSLDSPSESAEPTEEFDDMVELIYKKIIDDEDRIMKNDPEKMRYSGTGSMQSLVKKYDIVSNSGERKLRSIIHEIQECLAQLTPSNIIRLKQIIKENKKKSAGTRKKGGSSNSENNTRKNV